MKHPLAIAAACGLLLGSGVVHGLLTDRWGRDREVIAAAADRLAAVPVRVGDWVGSDQELEADQAKLAGIQGSLVRRYRHTGSGDTVALVIVCGSPGPIAVHTPDVCYAGSGYRPESPPVRLPVETAAGPTDQCWAATFRNPDAAIPKRIEVLWAWNGSGAWEAVDQPRWRFARRPNLFKLYLSREITGAGQARRYETCQSFLRKLLPDVRGLGPVRPPASAAELTDSLHTSLCYGPRARFPS